MKELLRLVALCLSVPLGLVLLGVIGFRAGWLVLCAVFGCP